MGGKVVDILPDLDDDDDVEFRCDGSGGNDSDGDKTFGKDGFR